MTDRKKNAEFGRGWIERIARWQPWYILSRSRGPRARAVFVVIGGFMAITFLGIVAAIGRWPILFPSLGPTAFLVFSAPSVPTSSPRNVLFSHILGIGCGWISLLVTGGWGAGPTNPEDLTAARIIAPSIAMALAGGIMLLVDCVHTPGISTALLVSLGLLPGFGQLAALVVAASLLCGLAWCINRLCGLYYPVWACAPVIHNDGLATRALLIEESPPTSTEDDALADLARDLVTGRR